MKYLFILSLFISAAFNASGQSDKYAGKDTIPVVYEQNPVKAKPQLAYFVNGLFFKPSFLHLNPDQIKNIRVEKGDTVIDGEQYQGMIFIMIKNFQPAATQASMISLNTLKQRYTTLKKDPVLFTIDDKLINQDYNTYRIDEYSILKIIVVPFAGGERNKPLWLVKIQTKTSAKAKRIMLRGTDALAIQ